MTPYYKDCNVVIYHGDNDRVLPALHAEGLFDFLLTDPPYNIKYDASEKKHGKDMSKDGIGRIAVEGDDSYFYAKKLAHLRVPSIIWGANCFASSLPDMNGWLTWLKTAPAAVASVSQAGVKLRKADMELAWTNFVRRPQAYMMQWIGTAFDDADGKLFLGENHHPTGKPIELMKWCLNLAPKECSVVIDPYMGGGSTLVAACCLDGWKGIGIELEEKYCEMAARHCEKMLGRQRAARYEDGAVTTTTDTTPNLFEGD